MRRLSSPLLPILFGLLFSGCVEMLRRPPADGVNPPLAAATEPAAEADEKQVEKPQSPSSSASLQPPAPLPHAKRTRKQEKATGQINEYALWCIENSMWNEARSHMERALAQDSLSASLHNNLAIIYEHSGQADKAAEFYRRAWALNPENATYEENLQRLERRRQAAVDTTEQVDIFDLKKRTPGPQRDPYQRVEPLVKGE